MNPASRDLDLSEEEVMVLAEILESERARMLVGIRHTFHRNYRDELHRRLDLLDLVIERLARLAAPGNKLATPEKA